MRSKKKAAHALARRAAKSLPQTYGEMRRGSINSSTRRGQAQSAHAPPVTHPGEQTTLLPIRKEFEMSKPITKPKRSRLHPVLSDAAFIKTPEGRAAMIANARALGIDVDGIEAEVRNATRRSARAD
jgi:hypothetical protein